MAPPCRDLLARRLAALAAVFLLALVAAAPGATAKPSAPVVERSPAEISTAFRNPGMGWLTYSFRPVTRPNLAFSGGPSEAKTTPLSSTVYTNYFTWADLEPVEGRYRWDRIDSFLQAWPGRAVRLGIVSGGRCSSFGMDPVPAWAKSQIDGGYYTRSDYWEPRYTNPIFQAKWGAFLRAFAQRYYHTSPGGLEWRDRIVSVDIDSFGVYGEWWSKFDFGEQDVAFGAFVDSHTQTAPIEISFDDVAVSRPDGTTVAADSFSRTTAGGWGTDDNGQAYTRGTRAWTVDGSEGTATAAPGTGGRIAFAMVSERDVDVAASIGADRRPLNGSVTIDLIARSGSSSSTRGEYLGRVTIGSSGALRLQVRKRVGGTESTIGTVQTVPGLSFDPAARYRVRFDVVGASPTQLRLKLWRAGTAEPAGWTIAVADDDPALQTAPVTSDLRYRTLKTLVDRYFDAFSGPYRPELAMNAPDRSPSTSAPTARSGPPAGPMRSRRRETPTRPGSRA